MAPRFRSFFRSERTYGENPKLVTRTRVSMDEEDSFEDASGESTPLSAVADAFEELSAVVKSKGCGFDLRLKPFCDACSLVSVLFTSLGIAFKFAELEYVSKVSDLVDASKVYGTLNNILDFDVKHDTVRIQGSLSRKLRRVRQGLDLVRALFQNFLSSRMLHFPSLPIDSLDKFYVEAVAWCYAVLSNHEHNVHGKFELGETRDCCLREAASIAYAKTCAPYHTWAVRTAVSAGMYALPTREQLLLRLNESEESAEKEMQRYIDAALPIIQYIDKLYTLRSISLDW